MRVVPRIVMVDTEPSVMDEIRSGPYCRLFHPDSLISGKEDCGSNFARGYYTLGSELIECTMDNIRRVAEKCSNLRGFLMFRAIGGGTGSGLGTLMMEKIQSIYGKIPRVEFVISPSPSMAPLVTEPYNAVLATHKTAEASECTFFIENEALYDICAKNLEVNSPTYTNINRIIGQVVSTFTSSQRFFVGSSIAFAEFPMNLVPFPRMHFPLVSYGPLINVARSSFGQFSTEEITNQCFESSNQMTLCTPVKAKYMACALCYRGEVSPADINRSISNIKKRNSTHFVEWSPTGFKIGLVSKLPVVLPGGDIAATNRSVVCMANNTAIQNPFCRITTKFNMLISRKAFVHHYIGEGLEEDTLKMASEDMCGLIKEYQKVERPLQSG